MESTTTSAGDEVNGGSIVDGGCSSWRCETNWTVTRGSLESSVVFESSDCPIEDCGSRQGSPLILKPPSPDSGPCEIKICFRSRHDIRQVYVRSTARVYEIYCTPARYSSSEYICTVRCSIAERDEGLLQATENERSAVELTKHPIEALNNERLTEGNIATSEDNWVEVKVPDSPLVVNGNSSLPKETTIDSGEIIQDFYEATAQISDGDPCILLTIRLLSLQNKDHVYIDEVYVFADSTESTDSENQTVPQGSLAGSSLMSFLVPTLLQLSKSGIRQRQDRDASDSKGKNNEVETVGRTTQSAAIVTGIHQDMKLTFDSQHEELHEIDRGTAQLAKSQLTQVDNRENNVDSATTNDISQGHIEKLLEQLVSRVSRIEEICLRFEERMVEPINSLDMRLQNVEQQLEILTKNSQHSGFPHCTRISAPSFSCDESDSSSLCNDRNDYPPCGPSGLENTDFPSTESSNPYNDLAIVTNAPHLPSLVVAAPEFSFSEDEEEDELLVPLKHSPCEKPKKPVSIDDALAAALSGFLSTSVVCPSEDTHSDVLAPGIAAEINHKGELSECAQTAPPTAPEIERNDGIDTEFPAAIPLNTKIEGKCNQEEMDWESPSVMGYGTSKKNDNDDKIAFPHRRHGMLPSGLPWEDVSEAEDMRGQFCREGKSASLNDDSNCPSDQTSSSLNPKGHQFVSDSYPQELSEILFSQNIEDNPFSDRQSEIDSQIIESAPETAADNPSTGRQSEIDSKIIESASETVAHSAAESRKGFLQDLARYTKPSVVDFDFSVLDVKFSHENSTMRSPIEALLSDVADINDQTPAEENSYGIETVEHTDFIVMDNDALTDYSTDNHCVFDFTPHDVDPALSMEGELVEPCASGNGAISVSLI